MSNDKLIAKARETFVNLTRHSGEPETYVTHIEGLLGKAGVGFEALDPEGKRSATEMKAEVDAAVKGRNIVLARETFVNLTRHSGDPETYVTRIEGLLGKAGVGFEALDPEGKRSATEMKAEVDAAVKGRNIVLARETFVNLTRHSGEPETYVTRIEGLLGKAGVGFEALDPEGKRSATEMKAEVDAAVKGRNIVLARETFVNLTRHSGEPETYVTRIEGLLGKAGVGFEALDPEGKRSATEMKAEVDAAVKGRNIVLVRETFVNLTRHSDEPETYVTRIEGLLGKAGVGFEALDLEGKRSATEMKAEVDAAVKGRNIVLARETFVNLTRHSDEPETYVTRIEGLLGKAGVGFEALDLEGKRSATEMKAEVDAAVQARNKALGRTPPRPEGIYGARPENPAAKR